MDSNQVGQVTKIGRCSNDGSAEGFLSDNARKAKVAQFNLRKFGVGRQQNVLGFQVAVDDVLAVQVFQGHQNLQAKRN